MINQGSHRHHPSGKQPHLHDKLRQQLATSMRKAEEKKEVLMVQDLQDKITKKLHKNVCQLFYDCEDERCDDQYSEVLDRNFDLESVNTDALHQFLEEEKERKRQEQMVKKANILIDFIKKKD